MSRAQVLTREYIRLGSRVIAIESPGANAIRVRTTPTTHSYQVIVNPAGQPQPYTGEQTIAVPAGASVTVTITDPIQAGVAGERFVFSKWSDENIQPSRTVTVTGLVELTAVFRRQVEISVLAAELATATATYTAVETGKCSSQTGTSTTTGPAKVWCDQGAQLSLSANPSTGFVWTVTPSAAGTIAGSTFTANNPGTIRALYSAPGTVPVTLRTVPAGIALTVEGTVYATDITQNWPAGSRRTIGAPDVIDGDIKYVFLNWSDGGARTHNVTPTVATTYTATFKKQYRVTMAAAPANLGSTSPPAGADNWIDAGQPVMISATGLNGGVFREWTGSGSGSYVGRSNPTTIPAVNNPITQTANFDGGFSLEPRYTTLRGPGKTIAREERADTKRVLRRGQAAKYRQRKTKT